MTRTAEPLAPARTAVTADIQTLDTLQRGQGVELLGDIHGCGYREGAYLVRRADGQMVQLGPLMYGLLEVVDGHRGTHELASALSERLGRPFGDDHVLRLSHKLAAQGLLAGTEQHPPPRRNPLLALRWKVLVTNPKVTRMLTSPFTVLFRPWLMWPIVLCFAVVCWFVLIQKGVSSATAEAFQNPALFLLVFVLGIVSAAFHELGHAAAARYGGATPGGMGMGLYLVWPAFYTDVTEAYRLPKRDRLRVDLAGLYFNAVVAVLTLGVWLFARVDALLLLVAIQLLQMVKQLSPVIRADGYHILSDATGVPDLFAHMRPTLLRLIPGHRREPSALTGRARALITLWVLVVIPVMFSLMVGAVLLLPRLAASAWASGDRIVSTIPADVGHGRILSVLVSLVSLVALVLPVLGSILVSQRIVRTTVMKAQSWSRGHVVRRVAVFLAGMATVVGACFAWWPSGQYVPVSAHQRGTVGDLLNLGPWHSGTTGAAITPGRHLAVAMVPRGGVSDSRPAFYIVPGTNGSPPLALVSGSDSMAVSFPFQLPSAPGPGDTQALAIGTQADGVTYDIAYSLVTVAAGGNVTDANRAYALADCQGCTTVAVSFQVVLVVGQSQIITPTNGAVALNYDCPACSTTAIADQIVVTLRSQPSDALLAQLQQSLANLNALSALGANGTPAAVASAVATVQQQVENQLNQSGLVANPSPSSSSTTMSSSTQSGNGTPTPSASATLSAPPSTSPSLSAVSPSP